MSKYYLAYGSNLSVQQMFHRCPDAYYVGWCWLHDYRLLFKGSKTGSYLTVEKKKGSMVPCLVWLVSDEDEAKLDRYEGYPSFYYKKTMNVQLLTLGTHQIDSDIEVMIYIMHEERKLGYPTEYYYDVCLEGYQRFGFDEKILAQALKDSAAGIKKQKKQSGSKAYDDANPPASNPHWGLWRTK